MSSDCQKKKNGGIKRGGDTKKGKVIVKSRHKSIFFAWSNADSTNMLYKSKHANKLRCACETLNVNLHQLHGKWKAELCSEILKAKSGLSKESIKKE